MRFFGLLVSGKRATLIERLVNHLLGDYRRTYQTSFRIFLHTFARGNPAVIQRFELYDDATSELSWPLYASFLGFVADPNVFKETASDSEIFRLLPWFIGLVAETKDTCKQIDQIKSAELKELLQLRLLCADHSRQWKNMHNKCGGHHR